MIITHNGTILTNDGVVLNNIITSPSFINTYSLDFDGVSDKLLFSSSNWGADSFSISMWINPSVLSGYRMLLGGSGYSVGTGLGHYIFGNTVKTWVSTGGFAQNLFTTSAVLSIGTWCHIVLVRNKNVSWDLYINGILTKQSYIRLTEDYTSDESLIARHYNNNSFNYGGKIDEVSIFNYGLLPTEVSDIYNLGTPKNLTSLNPITWFRMGDNGAYKDPQWLIPSNENKDKVSNYSMEFDGLDDYIDCGNDNSINISGDLTLSAWVFIPSYPGDFYGIFSKIDGSTRNYEVLIRPTGQISFYTSNTLFTTSTNSVSLNTWTHVLVTVNSGVAGGVKFYFNGVLDVTTGTQTVVAQTHNLNLGRRSTGDFDLNGKLDDVSIFPRVLTSGEISTISTEPTDLTPLNPSAWWKMGENATFVYGANPDGTWTIPDEVGTNNGTSNNLMVDSARVGTAPSSSNNALSFNMDLIDRVEDTPPTP